MAGQLCHTRGVATPNLASRGREARAGAGALGHHPAPSLSQTRCCSGARGSHPSPPVQTAPDNTISSNPTLS